MTIRIVGPSIARSGKSELGHGVAQAAGWFQRVEDACSRFDERSELRQLSAHIGKPVPVSAILFQAIQFALKVAEETNGAFDPTVGWRMETRGFNRHYQSGEPVRNAPLADATGTYRDVRLDATNRTVTLMRPLGLDLGAVAKGLAVDLAARELEAFENFTIDAGGDLYLAGCNADDEPWSVGIRHPRDPQAFIHRLYLSRAAVCTSGDYERVTADGHHLLDPRTGNCAVLSASATVVGPNAMMADALATAAFVLGPVEGLQLLENSEVDGLIVTPALEIFLTPGLRDE